VGSVMSSIYRSQLTDALPVDVPASAAAAAHDSLGAALQVSSQLGATGAQVVTVARNAFVTAMSRASIVVACVAALSAAVAWRYLPARASDEVDAAEESVIAPTSRPAWYVRACTCEQWYGRACE